MARTGVTSVHDAQGGPEDLRAYQDAHEAGDLSARVYCLIDSPHFDQMLAAGVRTGLGNEWVRVGALKLTCDGSISERTARLSEPTSATDDQLVAEGQNYSPPRRKPVVVGRPCEQRRGHRHVASLGRARRNCRVGTTVSTQHCTVVNDSLVSDLRGCVDPFLNASHTEKRCGSAGGWIECLGTVSWTGISGH
jgi:hypothetical protein